MKNDLIRIARTLFGLLLLGNLLVAGCGGGGSDEDPDFELTNPLVSISTLKNLAVDQFAYYATEAISEPDIEIWITDADTDELLVCSHGGLGMDKVLTEGVVYGNLNATFEGKIESEIYDGKSFKVLVYHNYKEPCVDNVPEDNWLFEPSRWEERFIGESEPVGYVALVNEPIFATNGGFYVRLKETAEAESYPMPFSIVASLAKDQLVVDQSYVADSYHPGSFIFALNVEVRQIESDQSKTDDTENAESKYGEMIGCVGSGNGMGSISSQGIKYGKLLATIIDENNIPVIFSGHKGKMVKVIMSFGFGCPKSIDADDVIIGESSSILWDELSGSQVWMGNDLGYVVFSNVAE